MTIGHTPLWRRARRCSAGLAAVAALATTAACAGDATSDDSDGNSSTTTLSLVNTKYGAELLPITAGIERGVFEEHGVDLQITQAESSDVATSALVSGRQDLGLVQAAFVVSANAAGADLVMTGTLMDQLDYRIIVSEDVESLEDLAGTKMGNPGPNNGNTATMKAVMDSAGIGSDSLTYVTVGTQAAILAAIQAGQVQSGLLVAPFTLQARDAGLNDLGPVVDHVPGMSSGVFAGTPESLEENSEVVRNFLAAMVESAQWCLDNPEEAVAILAESEDMTPEVAQASYDEISPTYTQDGSLSRQGLDGWIDVAVKYGVMNRPVEVDDIYSDEFLPER